MKEDVEIRPRPPRKRRQMEQALPQELAVWVDDINLTPSERRRAHEERERRKRADHRQVVGFSGTRAGMTPPQKRAIRELIENTEIREVHHGDCAGADVTLHDMLIVMQARAFEIVVHPPEDGRYRAFCKGDRAEPALPYLDRNKEIVKTATVLWATPKEATEPEPGRGQGTWSTIRYARKRGVARVIVMPDGTQTTD